LSIVEDQSQSCCQYHIILLKSVHKVQRQHKNSIQFNLFDVYIRGSMTFVNKQNNSKGHQGRLTSAQTKKNKKYNNTINSTANYRVFYKNSRSIALFV